MMLLREVLPDQRELDMVCRLPGGTDIEGHVARCILRRKVVDVADDDPVDAEALNSRITKMLEIEPPYFDLPMAGLKR